MSDATSASGATDKVAFGRYKLLHMLAQGGMGEVYLAKLSGAAGFEKLCVLKTILPNFSEAEDFVQRFHHEARTLVQLNHANIAQIYDMGEADKTYYMALEYVAGVDLARVLKHTKERGEPVPIPIAIYVGQRVAEALGYAHRKTDPEGRPMAIVHRDMSPHNVLVSYEGEVKVIDFGLAKSAARSLHTMPATVLGKLGYMSPEQARAEEIDQRSDIFSCGVVVWELLATRPLVKRGTFAEMLSAMANPKILPLTDIRPEMTPELNEVVLRALAAKAEDRYQRADEFAAALNEEFVKYKPPITAEKVGDYIRSLCPEEFEQQRKMLSGLSVLNKPETQRRPSVRPTTLERSKSSRTSPGDGPDATALRKSNAPNTADEEIEDTARGVGPTVMRPSQLTRAPKSKAAFIGALAGGVVVAILAGVMYLRSSSSTQDPPKAPPTEAKPPPVAAVPTPAPVPTPGVKPPEPAPTSPTATTPSTTQASGAAAAERRKSLEREMEKLKRQYDALVAKAGADQLEPMTTVAYDEARDEFKKGIANPAHYADIEKALKDAERYVSADRRRLGQ